jgi:hypothetical protein
MSSGAYMPHLTIFDFISINTIIKLFNAYMLDKEEFGDSEDPSYLRKKVVIS